MENPEPRDELDEMLGDLADGTPVDWSGLGEMDPATRRALGAIERLSRAARSDESARTAERGFDRLELLRREATDSDARRALELLGRGASDTDAMRGFERLELLGRGAQGEVWRARDLALNRLVALKLVPASAGASGADRRRFLAEARRLAAVEHENVVRIHAVDEDADGIRLVLEHVDGRTLQQLVERDGPMSAEEAARVGVDLCRALAAIHAAGLAHKDVKPANVMRAKGGRTVLLDFGIARPRAPSPGETEVQAIGTPMFMPPEELLDGRPSGERGDLYSAGATLYWLVTGASMFAAKTLAELVTQASARGGRRLRDVRPDLPAEFVAVVEKATAQDPAQRYATAGEMEQALLGFLAGASANSPRSAPKHSALRWIAAAAAFVALVAVAAAIADAVRTPPSVQASDAFAFDARWQLIPGGEAKATPVALREDDAVDVGDGLALDLSCSQPAYVYVFNEDATGVLSRLTPHPDFELAQPIPAESTARLPGREKRGRGDFWLVNTRGGGTESFVVVATPTRLAAVESMSASVPVTRTALAVALRSVGGHPAAHDSEEMPSGGSLDTALAALGPELRPYWRTFRLRNAPR